ncbi:hypothetical protein U4E84_01635 [Halorubrum sp. AD140]|uniref:hypothetical protein n=1 Tax=Halorubrum sp. AD140 TaxID=3050073 RepID=UPI002ACCE903|nr:hypothetical protein [Halorubrum sp. AD140]MDZ5810056.1 hypothetical protein [Halorubrum sp. AD140]
MSTTKPLLKNESGVDEVSFAGTDHIQTPTYSPEIKSYEDLFVLLKYGKALDDGAPITVPGHSWRSIRSEPKFKDFTSQIESLVRDHPIIYREPVELFRYRRPQRLVSYGLAGGSSRSFYKKLRNEEYDQAIEMLPEFFQPFLEAQMERLLEVKEYAIPERFDNTLRTATEGWHDKRANKGWPNYFASIAKDAQKSPDAGVVPPVPPVTRGSSQQDIDRAMGANQGMVNTCREVNAGHFGSIVYPYLHVYADYSVLKDGTRNDRKILESVRQEIRDREAESSFTDIGNGGISYYGVVLTLSGVSKAWDSGLSVRLERFVSELENVASSFDLPLLMSRTTWHGLYLTDYGVKTFSSLLNGNENYSQRGSGIGKEAKYGTTPFYGKALDLPISEAFTAIQNQGGSVHPISGLPDQPTSYDPTASSWEGRVGTDKEYRVDFGKARRLVHAQEAREVREGRRRGTSKPAKQYLRRSEHNDFS